MSSRAFVFTLNNPSPEDPVGYVRQLEQLPHVRYGIFQLELSPSGTRHYQGYLEFEKTKRRAWLSRRMPRAWLQPRAPDSSREQARDYARKADTRLDGPWEFGDFEAGMSPVFTLVRRVTEGGETSYVHGSSFISPTNPPYGFVRHENTYVYLDCH